MVHGVVSEQARMRGVVFVANFTVVFHQRLSSHDFIMRVATVRRQAGRQVEVLATDLALETFLVVVEILVLRCVEAALERFVAHFAFVFFDALVCSHVELDECFGRVFVNITDMAKVKALFVVSFGMEGIVQVVREFFGAFFASQRYL